MSAKETIEKLKKARIITALVTPFKENGQINFEAFPKLVEDLLASHTEGLILAGTTASLGINGGGLVSRTYNAVNEWNQSYEEEEGEHGKIKETLTAGEQYVDF